MTSIGDWGSIIDEAEAKHFVGRGRELDTFRQQIALNKPRYLIFYITGQGGAGKTTLLNRYQEAAETFSFLIADSDEQQRDVPTMLGRFAHQLTAQSFPLKRFNERYKLYRQRMDEIENDPEAPQGLAAVLGRMVVRGAYIVGDMVPGLRKGLEYLPQESLETQASEWSAYLAKKLTNKDEVALMREPIPVLTSLFFDDLKEIAQTRKVLLCFDNFEATRPGLQEWLLRLPEYKPSQNIRIVIAGRDEPGAKWDPLQRVTCIVRLNVFTEQEAEAFLDTFAITNPKRRKEILELSGRLPVLMNWLAVMEGDGPDPSVPTHDIVERFLRWVTDPTLRQVALLAAIPRTLNVDILQRLLKNPSRTTDAQAAFDWLQTMPFVQQHAQGWQYHEIVRRMILYYQRQKSPQMYRQTHLDLANFYETERHELSSPTNELWRNKEWRQYTLAYIYHFLVAHPVKHWGEAISLFVVALRKRLSFALEMLEALSSDDVQGDLSPEQNGIVLLFHQQLHAVMDGRLQEGFVMFDRLCGLTYISSQAKGYAFAYRGECHRLDGRWDQALSDFEVALRFIPEDSETIAYRGLTYLFMERYQEASDDFDRAISLGGTKAWIYAERGETYREMGHYQEALADFNRAITLDQSYLWAIARRGETYRQMGRYQEALADFDRAGTPKQDAWTILGQGETYLQLGRYQEALVNFDQAIALEGHEAWHRYCRALVYLLTGQASAFESEIQTAVELAEAALLNKSDEWRIRFDLALYNLVGGNREIAMSQYEQLVMICSSLPKLQVAMEDLSTFLILQPSNGLAHQIRIQLQDRIDELKQSSTE